jgi:hypothetical protein
MRIAKNITPSEEGAGIMTIVVMRPYPNLERELSSTFKGQKEVNVILDRRYKERRKREQAFEIERRQAEQRRPKEELVEVVIST